MNDLEKIAYLFETLCIVAQTALNRKQILEKALYGNVEKTQKEK